jgi:phosphate:Na+ symporter
MKIYECIISLLAGTGVFIAAMNMMSTHLQKVAGAGMRRLLGKITNNRLAGVGIGAVVTMIIQSSAATTVMAIGFVNAETMNLHQATAIIMGANIGTTITGILASLQSLNLSIYFSFLAFIGVVLMFFKKDILKNIGGIICGLGMIFIGLDLMSNSCKDDSIKSVLKTGLEKMDFPLALLLLGVIFTALMQSSSAMTGLIIVMVQGGSMEMGSGLFIILGANIGTCVTALISTIGTSINARRTGIIHLLFNCFGTLLFTIFIWILKNQVIKFLGILTSQPAMQIAWFHVFFNVITTLILLPMINFLVYVACKIVKEKNGNNGEKQKPIKAFKFINKRFLRAPDIAVEQIKKEIKNMASLAKKNLTRSISELLYQNNEYVEEISAREDLIDFLNIETTKFLVKIAPSINEKTAEDVSKYFHLLNDIERIGDHAKTILDESNEMKSKGIKFSQEAIDEFNKVFELIEKLFDLSIKAFDNNTHKGIEDYSTLLEQFKNLSKEYVMKHFERLRQGKCSMELGSFFTSTFAHFNSITSHLENIIGSFKVEEEIKINNTFDNKKGYVLVLNENSAKSKGDDISTTRKYIASEISVSDNNIDNSEKNNKSIC